LNKYYWFSHHHDAHQDTWIREAVRKQGHVAGWVWWCILELLHKHGIGDTLKININDVSKACLTSNSVVNRVLTQLGTEFQGKSRLSWNLVGTELELTIPKFRERQGNWKSKTIPNQSQNQLTVHNSTVHNKTSTLKTLVETKKKRIVSTVQIGDEYFKTLKDNPAFNGLNIEKEFHKMKAWCDLNGKQPTKKRFLSWLNRADPILSAKKELKAVDRGHLPWKRPEWMKEGLS